VKLLTLTENAGFAGGNIEAYKIATGEFIALLNNDAVLTATWLEKMIAHLRMDPEIGICSSKILVYGTNRVDSVGEFFTTAFTVVRPGEGEDGDGFHKPRFVTGACAAAVVYRQKMLNKIGFLDKDFFLNHEDNDLSLRAWFSGWKCLFVPEAVAYHKVSTTIGVLSNTSVYHFSRNTEWLWIKNAPTKLLLKYLPQRIIYELLSFGYFCLIKYKWGPYLKGKMDALLLLPRMLKKRACTQRLVKLSNAEIEEDLLPLKSYLLDRLKIIIPKGVFKE
jgi:GT2 family glycosyltransferase